MDMLKTIVAITGRPGLYKRISQGKNMLIVESLLEHKKVPAYPQDKVVSLGDIAIYTEEEEVPLSKVLTTIQTKENGAAIAMDLKAAKPDELRAYFAEILPNFDRDRVYPSDIRKIISWYNLLVKENLTDFSSEKDEAAEEKPEEDSAAKE
jgi:hypothetical protein